MTFDYDLFVVGGGSGGVRAARIAANHGARVAIAEEHRYGGTCVIRGCVPKKLFVYASQFGAVVDDAGGYGWDVSASFDWQDLRKRKDAEIDRLNGIYRNVLEQNGVTVLNGHAELADAHTIALDSKHVTADKILLATGATPKSPEIPGVELSITSNEAFYLDSLPPRIAVVGGGYIGLEFAGIFHNLGADVRLVHHRDKVLRGFDDDVREQVTHNLVREGITTCFDTEISEIKKTKGGISFRCTDGIEAEVDTIMFAIGRTPKTANLGLANAGVHTGTRGEIIVGDDQRTNVDNIFAVGDCTGRMALTPVAIREGQAFADSIFGGNATTVNLDLVPTAVFCQPEVGTVGLSEQSARARGNVRIYRSEFRPLFHTMTGRDEKVMIKLVVDDVSDRVLGVHMVGHGAAEIAQLAAVALTAGATKTHFDQTIALHPTTAEELVLMQTPLQTSG